MNFSKMHALVCRRPLLNPAFEGYKLQLLDKDRVDSSILTNKIEFDLSNDAVSKRTLTFSELKWVSKYNHAQNKVTFGTREGTFVIDSELNIIWIECSEIGQITWSYITSIKDAEFIGKLSTLPTLKVLHSTETSSCLIVFSGRCRAFIVDFSIDDLSAKVSHSFDLPKISSSNSEETWTLMDACRAVGTSDYKLVACVKTANPEQAFSLVVLELKDFELKLTCNIRGSDFPLMSKIILDGSGFFVASKKQFGLDLSSAGDEPKSQVPQPEFPYTWLQTSEDLTVYFSLKNAIRLKDLNCILKDDTFHLEEPNSFDQPIKQSWFGRINSADSLWTIEDGKWLTLHLEKADKGTRWSNLFDFDDGILEALDPNELAEIRESLDKYTGDPKPRYSLQQPFGSEIEQEDFEGEDFGLFLHDFNGHQQHVFSSAGMNWLGESLRDPRSTLSHFFLRYDVDALVFADQPPFKHSSTFDAMGYVQASKKNCKFITLSSDLCLMMIVESAFNVYLYGKPSLSRRQAPQAVLQIPSEHLIQGVQILHDKFLLILTQSEIFTFDLSHFISQNSTEL